MSQPQVLSLLERTLREPAIKLGFNRIQVAIPINELKIDDVRELKIRALNALKYAIQSDGKIPNAYDVTQILRIEGIDIPDDWSFTISNTGWSEVLSATVPQDTYLVIYGLAILDSEERVERVRILNGTNILADIYVHTAYVDNSVPPELYLTMPIVYTPNDVIKLQVYAITTGDTRIMLRGYMATSAGKVLSSGS